MPAVSPAGGARRLSARLRGRSFGLTSVVGRYVVVTVSILAIALISVGALYDRFTKELETTLVGERQSAQEAATANRMVAFLETMQYQLAKISNYPGLSAFLADPEAPGTADIAALLRLEADVPDLYGLLFFDAAGHLKYAIAGQAASARPIGPRPDGAPKVCRWCRRTGWTSSAPPCPSRGAPAGCCCAAPCATAAPVPPAASRCTCALRP